MKYFKYVYRQHLHIDCKIEEVEQKSRTKVMQYREKQPFFILKLYHVLSFHSFILWTEFRARCMDVTRMDMGQ